MKDYPEFFTAEEELEEAISRPTPELVQMMKSIKGDFIFLGVAGKMGVSMAKMAKRACAKAGVDKRIMGVSRFSDLKQVDYLEKNGIETFKGDLLDTHFLNSLPEAENVIYLAGMKFGTDGKESFTWAMNSFLPGLVAERFKHSKIVAFSTGCVYPFADIATNGSTEKETPLPVGEYAQSCLGRERLFEYGSLKNGTKVCIARLNYSIETRYGVLVDIATQVYNGDTVDVTMGYATVIWQGDANDMILRAIQYCESPAKPLNISGPEVMSIKQLATDFGKIMGKEVKFTGTEAPAAYLVDSTEAYNLMGKPKVPLAQVIQWVAHWISSNNRTLGKPTHFEVRDGKY